MSVSTATALPSSALDLFSPTTLDPSAAIFLPLYSLNEGVNGNNHTQHNSSFSGQPLSNLVYNINKSNGTNNNVNNGNMNSNNTSNKSSIPILSSGNVKSGININIDDDINSSNLSQIVSLLTPLSLNVGNINFGAFGDTPTPLVANSNQTGTPPLLSNFPNIPLASPNMLNSSSTLNNNYNSNNFSLNNASRNSMTNDSIGFNFNSANSTFHNNSNDQNISSKTNYSNDVNYHGDSLYIDNNMDILSPPTNNHVLGRILEQEQRQSVVHNNFGNNDNNKQSTNNVLKNLNININSSTFAGHNLNSLLSNSISQISLPTPISITTPISALPTPFAITPVTFSSFHVNGHNHVENTTVSNISNNDINNNKNNNNINSSNDVSPKYFPIKQNHYDKNFSFYNGNGNHYSTNNGKPSINIVEENKQMEISNENKNKNNNFGHLIEEADLNFNIFLPNNYNNSNNPKAHHSNNINNINNIIKNNDGELHTRQQQQQQQQQRLNGHLQNNQSNIKTSINNNSQVETLSGDELSSNSSNSNTINNINKAKIAGSMLNEELKNKLDDIFYNITKRRLVIRQHQLQSQASTIKIGNTKSSWIEDLRQLFVPDRIIWLCGPPGSGKTSVAKYLMDYYKLNANAYINVNGNNNESPNNAYEEYEKLITQIFEKSYKKGLIIDGFCRKPEHVFAINYLRLKLSLIYGYIRFVIVILNVNETTSIARQLSINNLQSLPNNMLGYDFYYLQAKKRYSKFAKFMDTIVNLFKQAKSFRFQAIDANNSFNIVAHQVVQQCEYQSLIVKSQNPHYNKDKNEINTSNTNTNNNNVHIQQRNIMLTKSVQ